MKKTNDIKKYFEEINENLLLNHKLLFIKRYNYQNEKIMEKWLF